MAANEITFFSLVHVWRANSSFVVENHTESAHHSTCSNEMYDTKKKKRDEMGIFSETHGKKLVARFFLLLSSPQVSTCRFSALVYLFLFES